MIGMKRNEKNRENKVWQKDERENEIDNETYRKISDLSTNELAEFTRQANAKKQRVCLILE